MPSVVKIIPCLASILILCGVPSCLTPGGKPDAKAGATPAGQDALPPEGASATGEPELAGLLPGDLPPGDANLLPESLPELLPGESAAEPEWNDAQGGNVPEAEPGGWSRSGTTAIQRARQKELPVLLWFANPSAGPLDNMLGAEVLYTPPLEAILRDKAIGLRIDFASETVRRSGYYKAFLKRYAPKGYPTVLVLLPDGTELARYSGFVKGSGAGWRRRCEDDLKRAQSAWEKRKQELGKIGFRDWTSREGKKIFAKAIRREGKEAVLVDPYRRVFHVPLERFSNECLTDLLDNISEESGKKE